MTSPARSAVAALLLAFGLSGCSFSTPVSLPGGSTAYDISCGGGRWACTSEAESVCGGRPYVVLDESTALEIVSKGQQGGMRIQCADDYVAANTPSRPAPPPEPGTEGAESGALIVCRHAFTDAPRFGRSWAKTRGGAARSAPLPREDFMRTCLALPKATRPCLLVRYGVQHEAACRDAIVDLDDATKASLDALFLAPPPEAGEPAAPRPPADAL